MLRFTKNRWWTFLLALVLISAAGFSMPTRASAGSGGAQAGTGDTSGGGGGTGIGDPDNPTGKSSLRYGRMTAGNSTYRARAAGDGSGSDSVWVVRLRVVMDALQRVIFRF
jgi:hypothetical protein